jgi:hypothetical protein
MDEHNNQNPKIEWETFKKLVELNPNWAKSVKTPTHIVNCDNIQKSPIKCLSPLLHFHPKKQGACIKFWQCPNLKKPQGVFHSWVSFAFSGVTEVDSKNLTIFCTEATCLILYNCKELKMLRGTFPSSIRLSESGIEEIKGVSAHRFEASGCKNLIYIDPKILKETPIRMDPLTKMQVETHMKKLKLKTGQDLFI